MILFISYIILWATFIIIYPIIAYVGLFKISGEEFMVIMGSVIFGGLLILVILAGILMMFILPPFDKKIYEEAIRNKNFDEAIEFCTSKIDFSFQKDAEAWNQLVDAYYLKGEFEKAVHALKTMMGIKMRNNRAFEDLIALYLSKEDYQNAVDICNQYLEIYPKGRKLPIIIDKIYQKFTNWDEINNHFKKLGELAERYLSEFPNMLTLHYQFARSSLHKVYYLLAKIYDEQGNYEKSLEQVNKALEIRFSNLEYKEYKKNLLIKKKEKIIIDKLHSKFQRQARKNLLNKD